VLSEFWDSILPHAPLTVTNNERVHALEAAAAKVLAAAALCVIPDCAAQIESVTPAARFAYVIGLDQLLACALNLGLFWDAF
jgi:hypothetical protein